MTKFFRELPKGHPAKKIRQKKVDARGMHRVDGDLSWPGGGGPRYDILHPKTKKPCEVPSRGWVFPNPEDMQRLIDEDRIHFGSDHTKIPSLKTYLHELEGEVRTSIIMKQGQASVQLLKSIVSSMAIENPKDHELLAELFNLVTWRDPNTLIFDPYAGSGTTGHAVLAMNAEDGGQRRFMLVENGDPTNRKIPRDEYTNCLTAERVRRVFSGKWADGKDHPQLPGGFTFYEARKIVSKKMIMESTRENLADIILQIVEDDSNRVDCRMDGYQYLIGRTRLGFGIALVWEEGKTGGHQALTRDIRSKIMEEAQKAKVTKPVYIYAVANVSPLNDELYRFQQIPDSILARLGVFEEEEEEI
jgi:adenine-specific DNA-methyltransferase